MSKKPKTKPIVVKIEDLEVCPYNPRKRDLDLEPLNASVKKEGVSEVVEVHRHKDRYHIIAGQRRFLSAKNAGLKELECLEYPFDEDQAKKWCERNMIHQKEYHPLDIAEKVQSLVKEHGSIEKASKATGFHPSYLRARKAFREFFGDEATEPSDLEIDPEETLVEGVGGNTKEAIETLSLCGLNDAFLFLRRYKELSDGQKYRYKLAKLMDNKEKNVWLIDEFCATLDRVMAHIIAYLIQKVARRLGKTVIVATTHRDLVDDFQPDIIVEKGFERDIEVSRGDFAPKKCSIYENVCIEKGNIEDYNRLSRFHYRTKDKNKPESLRIKDCYKLLFNDELIGVIVYSPSYLNLKPRNIVFGERYVYTPGDLHKARLINEEIARISRVVVHPKFRGIGLGAYLVRETMPKVDAKVIEVLAVMAKYNPFFEKAGMIRVDYNRDEISEEKRIRCFLEARNFDFNLARSKTYGRHFFSQLDGRDKKVLLECLSEFARQPFIKTKTVTPDLLTRVFSSDSVYLYWVNSSLCRN